MIRLLFVPLALLAFVSACSSETKDIIKVESNRQNVVSAQKNFGSESMPPDEQKNVAAEQAKSTSVLDYYLLLPDKYFRYMPNDAKARRAAVKIEDVKNGYLKVEKPFELHDLSKLPKEDRELEEAENEATKLEAQMEVALFKQKHGRNIIVVSYPGDDDNPFEVFFKLDFWEDNNGVLKDVTERHRAKIDYEMAFAEFKRQRKPTDEYPSYKSAADMLPNDLHSELPRHGKTIKIIITPGFAKRRFELLHLVWNGEDFVCKPASKK